MSECARVMVGLSVGLALFLPSSAAFSAQPAVSSIEARGNRLGAPTTTEAAQKPGKPAKPAQRGAMKPTSVPFSGVEAILQWEQMYRVRPEPERIAEAFTAMRKLGMLREIEQAGLHLGFVGAVLSQMDTERAAKALAKMFPMPPMDQPALIKVIAMSGHPQWKALLRGLAERMPSRGVLMDRYLTGKMASLETMTLDAGPLPLDVLWGQYFATGSYEPIARIVSILKWAQDVNDVERLTIGSMAKFTLAQNGARDVDLLVQMKAALGAESGVTRAVLTEVIEAAETAETANLRKGALVAIEQLKVKGPEKTRNAQWWGQAGQTVLALGCVAASALGNVAVGLPCVIGGGLSNLAIKQLSAQ